MKVLFSKNDMIPHSKRQIGLSALFSVLLSLTIVVCHKFISDGTVFAQNSYDHAVMLYQLLMTIPILYFILLFVSDLTLEKDYIRSGFTVPWFHFSTKRRTIINSVIIFLILLPAFLALFPGYQSYDGPYAAGPYLTNGVLSSYQPVLHTLLISYCYKLGYLICNNCEAGVLIYVIIQEVAVIAILNIAINKMIEWKTPDFVICYLFLMLLLNPIVQIFIFATTKDTFFGIFLLLWLVCLIDNYIRKEASVIPAIISAILMCFFRKQGVYILVFTLPLYVMLVWKKRNQALRPLLTLIVPAIFYLLISGPVFVYLGVDEDPVAEKLSVPIQQIARVVSEEGDLLSSEELEEIKKFIPEENLQSYIPEISDPVKAGFNNDYYKNHRSEFWRLWFRLFINHKGTYLDSLLYGIVGYFYPKSEATNAWGYLCDYTLLLNMEYRIHPILKGYYAYLMSAGKTMFNNLPILSDLISIGMPVWALALTVFLALIKKKKAIWIVIFSAALYFSTLLLGPVCCIRYVIPLYFTIPLQGAVLFSQELD